MAGRWMFSLCTCYFMDPEGKGACGCRDHRSACQSCVVGTSSFIAGWMCCWCMGHFQTGITEDNMTKVRHSLIFMPANIASGDLFFRAVEDNKPDVVKMLLEKGGNANIKMSNGQLPMESAAKLGFWECIKEFYDKGALPPNGERGSTPLIYIAVRNGHFDTVKFLVEYCDVALDSDQMRFWDQVPLKRAAQLDYPDIAQYLCDHGADLEAESYPTTDPAQFTDTALSVSIKTGNLRMVHLLLKAGATRAHRTKFRRRMYDADALAKFFRQDLILEYFAKWELRVAVMHRDDMVEAAAAGDLERVDVQLQRNMPDINHIHRTINWGALHKASENEDLEMIEYLVEAGANINNKNKDGWTPVLHAVKLNAVTSIELLLRLGADHNIRNRKGDTPFSLAILLGYERTLLGLLRSGAGEKTPILELRKLKANCHPNVRHIMEAEYESIMINRGDNLVSICASGKLEMAQRVIEVYGADVNHCHSKDMQQGRTPFLAAAERGWSEVLVMLKEHGADPFSLVTTGDNALLLAAQWGHLDAVKTLLRMGHDVNFANETDGRSAARVATDRGHVEVVKELMMAGATVDWTDKKDFHSCLHRAAMHGYLDIADVLLIHGANVNRRDRTYTTPLLHACYHNHIKLAKYLIKRGAEWNSRNAEGLTPLDIGIKYKLPNMIKLFNGYRKKLSMQQALDLRNAVFGLRVDGIRKLLANNVDVVHMYPIPFKESKEWVLRHMEVHGRHLSKEQYSKVKEIHSLLLAAATLLNSRLAANRLLEWTETGDVDKVKVFLDTLGYAVDLNAHSGKEGTTPLIEAARANSFDICELLLGAGARVNVSNKYTGYTALMAAASHGNHRLVKLLLKKGADPMAVHWETDKTAARFATSNRVVSLIHEFETDITKIRDQERQDQEIKLYSEELGVPMDWFAVKRKDLLTESKSQYRDSQEKLKQRVARKLRRRAMGLEDDSGSEADDEDDVEEASRDGDTVTPRSIEGRPETGDSPVAPPTLPPGLTRHRSTSGESFTSGSSYSYSFTSGSSYSYYTDDEDAGAGAGGPPTRRRPPGYTSVADPEPADVRVRRRSQLTDAAGEAVVLYTEPEVETAGDETEPDEGDLVLENVEYEEGGEVEELAAEGSSREPTDMEPRLTTGESK